MQKIEGFFPVMHGVETQCFASLLIHTSVVPAAQNGLYIK
jgi:hypothetical protein